MSVTINRTHLDRLYGPIDFTNDDLRLYQTVEMTRLRDLSLSATPPLITATGICATKFEHTIGVAHLARILEKKPEFSDYYHNIYFACLAHDLGTPPFSHLSEHFQRLIMNEDHEEAVLNILANSESEFRREVIKQGGSIDTIVNYVTGRDKIIGRVINGSIDLDNLDNSLRYGLSKGILQTLAYSPVKLATCYGFQNSEVYLEERALPEIEGWETCRHLVYKYVYSFDNLTGGMMLFRAIGFACEAGEIKPDFFQFTDSEAYYYLKHRTNHKTRTLLEKITRWIFYPKVYEIFQENPSEKMLLAVKDLNTRMIFADELSSILNIPPEDIAIYVGYSKAFKNIDLPIVTTENDVIKFSNSTLRPLWQAHVYLSDDHISDCTIAKIQEFMDSKLDIKPT